MSVEVTGQPQILRFSSEMLDSRFLMRMKAPAWETIVTGPCGTQGLFISRCAHHMLLCESSR